FCLEDGKTERFQYRAFMTLWPYANTIHIEDENIIIVRFSSIGLYGF
ncbi:MAG: hypothetical protein ACI8P3_003854, partial [Saprospiraceae bacterium]